MPKYCFELSESEYENLKKVIEAAKVKEEVLTEAPAETKEETVVEAKEEVSSEEKPVE